MPGPAINVVPGRAHHAPASANGVAIVRVAPDPLFYVGLVFVAAVCLSYWWLVRFHLTNCECKKRTLLPQKRRR